MEKPAIPRMKVGLFLETFEATGQRRQAPPKPYVAKVIGLGLNGMRREFLEGKRDLRFSNSVGSRGARLLFVLETGCLYEIRRVLNWNTFERYWTAPDESGHMEELNTREAIQWLKNNS
jgi:hypothetical protein